jgi:hypothetical protein
MDCREFLDKHTLFVDLTCSGLEEDEMRRHMRVCPKCSRHDTVVRRSLLLVRNLPCIEPSPDFKARLEARMRTGGPSAMGMARPARMSFGSFVAVAAGVAFVTYLATETVRRQPDVRMDGEIRMAPVVATLPEFEPSPVATSALVATVPTGMSIWPAIMVASQAPIHFAAAELASER